MLLLLLDSPPVGLALVRLLFRPPRPHIVPSTFLDIQTTKTSTPPYPAIPTNTNLRRHMQRHNGYL